MHDQFLAYISSHSETPLSTKDIDLIRKTFIANKLRKRQYFLQKGEVSKFMGFIVKGAMRQYSVDDSGMEHIVRLSVENWWVGDRESHINLTPSAYYIDAWEETELLQVTRADQIGEMRSIPAMIEMVRYLDDNFAIATQRRLNSHISLSAGERYAEFAKLYPDFIQRFPQHMIASYLGITKETLSRVRKQAVNK